MAQRLGPIFGDSFVSVDARDRFLHQLKGVIDPEDKRKRIGREFMPPLNEGDLLYMPTTDPSTARSPSSTARAVTIPPCCCPAARPRQLSWRRPTS